MASPGHTVHVVYLILLVTSSQDQCFFISRNIGQVTPKNIYFYYLENYFLNQSIQKIFNLILKTEALVRIWTSAAASAIAYSAPHETNVHIQDNHLISSGVANASAPGYIAKNVSKIAYIQTE